MFRLKSDPDELRDLSGDAESTEVMAELRGKLEAWLRKHNDSLLVKQEVGSPCARKSPVTGESEAEVWSASE